MKKKDARKNPFVLRRVIEAAGRQDRISETLTRVVEKIMALRETELV